jgi:hypothetical protein
MPAVCLMTRLRAAMYLLKARELFDWERPCEGPFFSSVDKMLKPLSVLA